uniref:Ladinin 1 n=1 Tax=Salvator merianae TaxID=96440 RepID=A0A8D0B3G6_SALMN
MSFNRRNWYTLSSLAQQRSVEDEEEQERERRRRHRQLSSTSEPKESSNTVQNEISRAPNRFSRSSEVRSPKLQSYKMENERTLSETKGKQQDRSLRRKEEISNNVKKDQKETVKTKKQGNNSAEKSLSETAQKNKDPTAKKHGGLVQPVDATEEKCQHLDEEKEETVAEAYKKLDKEEEKPSLKDEVFTTEQNAPNVAPTQGLATTRQPQRASWERKSISRLEVKIQPRVRNVSEAVFTVSPASGPQIGERSVPKAREVVSVSPGQDRAETHLLDSRPQITYSSSFKRITPRTISFRVVPKKDKDDTLSRSASMRLPASSTKLEEKLEKYTSAVQRAGSIKISPSTRRNFHPSLEGVASKRSIFEATVPIRTESTTPVRKESLKIPGGVTSRINLWISRTQDEGTKDIRSTENTVQQSQLGKRSENA